MTCVDCGAVIPQYEGTARYDGHTVINGIRKDILVPIGWNVRCAECGDVKYRILVTCHDQDGVHDQ